MVSDVADRSRGPAHDHNLGSDQGIAFRIAGLPLAAISGVDSPWADGFLPGWGGPADIAHLPFVRGWALADIVDAAVYAERDLGDVRRFVAEWESIAARTGAGHLLAQLSYARAMAADEAAAPRRFAAAVTETPGWPSCRARTQLAHGTWLRRRRRTAQELQIARSMAPCRQGSIASRRQRSCDGEEPGRR